MVESFAERFHLSDPTRRSFRTAPSRFFGDGEGTAQITAALWSPQGIFATRCRAPQALPPLFPGDSAAVHHIIVVECLAPLALLATFPDVLQSCCWYHYIDNTGALGMLVNGTSSAPLIGDAMSAVTAQCWELADRNRAHLFFITSFLLRPQQAQHHWWLFFLFSFLFLSFSFFFF